MKTILFALSLFAGTFFSTARASETPVDPTVAAAFTSRFARAANTEWAAAGALYKVRFTLDGQTNYAYYTADGTLVAVTRQLASTELPASLQAALRPSLAGSWITDLFVVTTDKGDTYYVTLENADRTLVLQSVRGRKWVNYATTEKL